jgi:AP endonuclease-2
MQGLVDKEKWEVVLGGDINACAAVIDHCEGHLLVAKGLTEGMSGEEGFWGKDADRCFVTIETQIHAFRPQMTNLYM